MPHFLLIFLVLQLCLWCLLFYPCAQLLSSEPMWRFFVSSNFMYKFLCAFHSEVLTPMKAHWFPLHGWRTAGVVSWREGFRLYNHQQVLLIQNACNISTGNWPCILCNCLSLM
jgi:hypothetical protein